MKKKNPKSISVYVIYKGDKLFDNRFYLEKREAEYNIWKECLTKSWKIKSMKLVEV